MEYLLSDLVEKEAGTQLSVNHGEPAAFFVDKIHGTLRYHTPKEIHSVGVVYVSEGVEVDLLAYLDDSFSHVDLTTHYPNLGGQCPIDGPALRF